MIFYIFEKQVYKTHQMMKKLLVLLLLAAGFPALSGQHNACFLTDPTLSPDGKTIVFVYETDLWEVPVNGGTAGRLTAMAGNESLPRFSPDGKWLAFSSTQNGNADVYLMPVGGGKIVQLTWHDANDLVDSWSWDSDKIYFTSERYNTFSAFVVSASGDTPQRLFSDNYFDQAHHVIEVPGDLASQKASFYFTSSWESYLFPHRKRYVGENSPDIEYFNPATGDYRRLTDWEGKDMWPVADRKGNLYIASDEANGEYNLYALKEGAKKQLTSFETSIGRPQVSADGSRIVFGRDYQIWSYDVAAGKSSLCEISIYATETLQTEIPYTTAGKITAFDISDDGKKVAFVSRGRIFVSDLTGKFVREIPTARNERAVEVRWMKDNVSLLYTRTVKGWANLFTVNAEDPEEEKQLTSNERTVQHLLLSPEGETAVYLSGSSNIDLIDLKNFSISTIINDEFTFRISQPRFSPDGKYIVYSAYRNFEEDILVYDIREKKIIPITNNGVTESDPYWSPDGRYIYLSADRYNPGFPRGEGVSKIYRIPLFRFAEGFRSDEYGKMFLKKPPKDSLQIDIRFDTDDIENRWEEIAVNGNSQSAPNVFYQKGKTLLLFNNSPTPQDRVLTKVEMSPFEPRKSEKIGDKPFSQLEEAGGKFYALIAGDIYEVKVAENKTEKLNLNADFSKNLNDEFVQMFYENWATLAEHFYDLNYHGISWTGMRTRYEAFLPFLRNRENLKTLQNDMLGELNSSHLGFSSQGDEAKTFYRLQTNATGIIFRDDEPFVVDRWVKKSPADLLDTPLKPGDELMAINGVAVNKSVDRELFFALPRLEKELVLRFSRKGKEFDMKLNPVSSSVVKALLYDEWVAANQKKVDEATDNRVAYVYMKDMGTPSLEQFLIEMTGEAARRDALILDIRNNRGGNVHDDVIQFLSQRPYLEWQAREGKRSPQPNFAPSGKPIILMVNEQSLSDAEMTAAAFKALKLGTVVGTETYRWIIFTSGKQLVDGSFTRLPAWGCYDLEGNDLEKTGVKPDIYVPATFGDMQKGADPQLDRAIEEALLRIKN